MSSNFAIIINYLASISGFDNISFVLMLFIKGPHRNAMKSMTSEIFVTRRRLVCLFTFAPHLFSITESPLV